MDRVVDGGKRAGARLTVVVPARLEADRIDLTLDGMLASTTDRCIDVSVICNGSVDETVERVDRRRSQFEARGWRLTAERIEEPGKCAAIRRGASAAEPGTIIVLDVRVGLRPDTIDRLVDGATTNGYEIASARLDYIVAGDAICRAFARGYGASPFGRSLDLKGTCVLVASERRDEISDLPDVPAEDRYYVSLVERSRRGSIEQAVVDYHFPTSARALVRQQIRWAAANNATEGLMGAHDRPAHETERRPYFGSAPPGWLDRIVFVAIGAFARLVARMRPMREPVW